MINLAVRIPPQKQCCQHPLAGDDALTTTAAKGRDNATLMTMAVPASLDKGGEDQRPTQQSTICGGGEGAKGETAKAGGKGGTAKAGSATRR